MLSRYSRWRGFGWPVWCTVRRGAELKLDRLGNSEIGIDYLARLLNTDDPGLERFDVILSMFFDRGLTLAKRCPTLSQA